LSSGYTPLAAQSATPPRAVLCGLLAEFDSVDAIKAAARKVRDAGFSHWDTHTPFPVHGIDAAMGIRATRLPLLVFAFGAIGCLTGLLLQWWANATSFTDFPIVRDTLGTFVQGYNYQVSGKPFWSLPANIPVIFELTVLFAALSCAIGMLVRNNLPWFYNPIFNTQRFERVTSDRFFVRIDASDPKFSLTETQRFLDGLGAVAIERVEDYPNPAAAKMPAAVSRAAVIVGCVLLAPLCIIWMARSNTSDAQRIHIIQDMDNQEKFKAQRASTLFADGRTMRPPVAGAVVHAADAGSARDDHFLRGYRIKKDAAGAETAVFYEDFPKQVLLNEAFVERGRNRFDIYCAPCHGYDGHGQGMVGNRAMEIGGWTAPVDLHDGERYVRPVGHLYNSITAGIRTMPAYGDQISDVDRWAIVAYVRALQRTTHATVEDLTPQQREILNKR
jgi:mono/diheme cytochrome c family protein